VAEFEGIRVDDVYDLGIVHVLNDLSYLKALDQHERALIEKWKNKT